MNQGLVDAAYKEYNNGYYSEKLEEGLQFQDVATRELYKRGVVVVGYASRKFQNEEGENMLGAEIKRDGMFRNTGNLYIEICEKSHPSKPTYTASGIFREDNSWIFVIGDEKTMWIFSTKYLRIIKDRFRHVEKPTSKGFLIPLEMADKYCLRRIDVGVDNG